MAIAISRINQSKLEAYRWRYELSVPYKLALCLGMAALTGLLAQAKVPLPWTPVPITGQRFAVLLAGGMRGLMLAANFILIYVPGLLQLGLWLDMVKGQPATFSGLMMMGAIPFIAG